MSTGNTMPTPARLHNPSGTNCYQNSVLQAVSTSTGLDTYLSTILGGEALLQEMKEGDRILQELNEIQTVSCESPGLTRPLFEVMGKLQGWRGLNKVHMPGNELYLLGNREQQDAEEYYQKIVNVLHEFKRVPVPPAPAFPAIHPLEGYLARRTTCKTCGLSDAVKQEPFQALILSLTRRPMNNDSERRLVSELDNFFDAEDVQSRCNRCILQSYESSFARGVAVHNSELHPSEHVVMQQRLDEIIDLANGNRFDDGTFRSSRVPEKYHVDTTKTAECWITHAPQNLVMYLPRTRGNLQKVQDPLSFPETLDLSPWIRNSAGDNEEQPIAPTQNHERMLADSHHRYKLSAVIVHEGGIDANSGHYSCWRQEHKLETQNGWAPGTWWKISDAHAFPCSVEALNGPEVKEGVTMLFYQRVDTPTRSSSSRLKSSPRPLSHNVIAHSRLRKQAQRRRHTKYLWRKKKALLHRLNATLFLARHQLLRYTLSPLRSCRRPKPKLAKRLPSDLPVTRMVRPQPYLRPLLNAWEIGPYQPIELDDSLPVEEDELMLDDFVRLEGDQPMTQVDLLPLEGIDRPACSLAWKCPLPPRVEPMTPGAVREDSVKARDVCIRSCLGVTPPKGASMTLVAEAEYCVGIQCAWIRRFLGILPPRGPRMTSQDLRQYLSPVIRAWNLRRVCEERRQRKLSTRCGGGNHRGFRRCL